MGKIIKCVICGRGGDGIAIDRDTGLCYKCGWEAQEEEERKLLNEISFPEGVITTWNDSPSFLDKKKNYMYFRIPDRQRLFFDHTKEYQIIVREIKNKVEE